MSGSVVVSVQFPLQQVWLPEQILSPGLGVFPQAPQLLGSVVVLVHVPPQQVGLLSEHLLPQAPQLLGSVLKSTQPFPQQVLPEVQEEAQAGRQRPLLILQICPVGQSGSEPQYSHCPVAHEAVGQIVPQLPQLLGSERKLGVVQALFIQQEPKAQSLGLSLGLQEHTPLAQLCPDAHAFPQLPQLLGSIAKSTGIELQQPGVVQGLPLTVHVVFPQLPQLLGSLVVATQLPLAQQEPGAQSLEPLQEHTPLIQLCPDAHVLLQMPQLLLSVLRSTQPVPQQAGVVNEGLLVVLHAEVEEQLPPEQVGAVQESGATHIILQAPQLFESVCKSEKLTQAPLQQI